MFNVSYNNVVTVSCISGVNLHWVLWERHRHAASHWQSI